MIVITNDFRIIFYFYIKLKLDNNQYIKSFKLSYTYIVYLDTDLGFSLSVKSKII